jgi:hypothetical protein
MSAKSIVQNNTENCFICKRHKSAVLGGLDKHHIYFGSYRNKSEKYGLFVFICHNECHIFGNKSVHRNANVDLALKKYAQAKAMKHYGWSKEQFIEIFGKNYI